MQERAAHRVAAHSGSGLALAVLPPRQCGGAVGRTMPRRHTRHHQHQPVVKLHAVARGPHETVVAMKYWSTTHDCTSATLACSPLHRAPLLMFTLQEATRESQRSPGCITGPVGTRSAVAFTRRGRATCPVAPGVAGPPSRTGVYTIPVRCGRHAAPRATAHFSLCVASVAQCYQHSKYSKKACVSRAVCRNLRCVSRLAAGGV